MAYVCYVACDECGTELAAFVNQTVSMTHFARIARKHGWAVGKSNWLCPKHRKRKLKKVEVSL